MRGGNRLHTNRSPYLGPAGHVLQVGWRYEGRGAIGVSPVIGHDGTVYAASDDGVYFALDGTTGVKKWEYLTHRYAFPSPAVTHGSVGLVYFAGEDGLVVALNSSTGAKVWDYDLEAPVYGSFTLGDDGTIFIGSDSRHLYSLSPSGKLKWKSPILEGTVWSAPAISDGGRIFLGVVADTPMYSVNTAGKTMYAFNSRDGTIAWSSAVGADVYSSPVLHSNLVIFGNDMGQVLALKQEDGAVAWNVSTALAHKWPGTNPVRSSPSITADGTLLVHVWSLGNLLALDASTGANKWAFATHWGGVGCPLLDASGAIFLGGFNFEVMKIVDGGLWSNFRTQSPVMSCPAITRTGVLVIGSDNSVYGLIGE